MLDDFESLRQSELGYTRLRLLAVPICAVLFPSVIFYSSLVAYIFLLFFAVWYLAQLLLVMPKLIDFEKLRNLSRINFIVDFFFITEIIANSANDPLWDAYILYVLIILTAIVQFGNKGGVVSTITTTAITTVLCLIRIFFGNSQEDIFNLIYRDALIAFSGGFCTATLTKVWLIARQTARVTAINELNRNLIVASVSGEAELHRRISDSACSLLRADGFMLALFSSKSAVFYTNNATPSTPNYRHSEVNQLFPAGLVLNGEIIELPSDNPGWEGDGIVKSCLEQRVPIKHNVISKDDIDSALLSQLPWYDRYIVQPGSFLFAPLISEDKVLGVISVQRGHGQIYDAASLALFGQLATLVATALSNVRTSVRQHRRINELALLNQIGWDLTEINDLTEIVTKLKGRLLDFFEANSVHFILNTEAEEEAEAVLKIGDLDEITHSDLGNYETMLLNDLMSQKKSLLIFDLAKYKKQYQSEAGKIPALNGCYLAVPLLSNESLFGVIAVYHSQSYRYSLDDLQLLETIAHQTATVIENIRLQRQTLHNLEEVRELYYMLLSKEGELRREAEERARFEGAVMTARAISHEIGQPLTAILGLITMARSGLALDNSDLALLEQETLRSREIIAKLRSVVRFETKAYVDQTDMLDLDASSQSHHSNQFH